MKKKIVFIGNSIVNGFPLRRSECFASLVRQDTGNEIINKGVNGDSTTGILWRFHRDVLAHKPDMVFILSGTNDFIYGEASPEEAFGNLLSMAECALQENIQPVFLTPLTVDPEMASEMWMKGAGVNYHDINMRLEELAALLRSSGHKYIDLTSAYRNCSKYHDGLHPTAEGHRFIADIIIKYLKETY